MTKAEYKAYTEAVERNMRGLEFVSTGACAGCPDCGLADKDCQSCDGEGYVFNEEKDDNEICPDCQGQGFIKATEDEIESAGEAGFSWGECDCCGSTLGGDRYPAHGIDRSHGKPEIHIHLSVCSDCLLYLNYGKLDDATMMEIEASAV